MSTKKTIQINPELFKLSGSSNKTRKNREKKELNLTPIVSPNKLKTKLLKRIQDFKKGEIKAGETKTKTNTTSNSDEFYSALDYLQKRKKDVEKEKHQTVLNSRTLKNYSSHNIMPVTNQSIPLVTNQYIPLLSSITTSPHVELDLPFDLQEPTPIKSSFFEAIDKNVMNIKYKSVEDVPYGCLKGGVKPSYRSWIQTRKNYETPINAMDMPSIRPPTPPKRNMFIDEPTPTSSVTTSTNTREQRLEHIKHKLRRIQDQENGSNPEYKALNSSLELLEPFGPGTKKALDTLIPFDDNKTEITDIPTLIEEAKITKGPELKNYIKRTIRRKFTLGRSDKLRKVGVLLKDKQTRKNVLNAQKELKKTNMTDVRKYLRQHGIIKVGSTAPNDVLRKTFEAAMLAGEITNLNKDVLLHNFLNAE